MTSHLSSRSFLFFFLSSFSKLFRRKLHQSLAFLPSFHAPTSKCASFHARYLARRVPSTMNIHGSTRYPTNNFSESYLFIYFFLSSKRATFEHLSFSLSLSFIISSPPFLFFAFFFLSLFLVVQPYFPFLCLIEESAEAEF